VWGRDRAEAIDRMARALSEYEVAGIKTNIAFFERLLAHPDFVAGELDTGLVTRALDDGLMSDVAAPPDEECVVMLAAAIHFIRAIRATQATPQAAANANGLAPGIAHMSPWKLAGREALLDRWPKK